MSTSSKPAAIGVYPSWYARYLLAFDNQLRCRERACHLRRRIIPEEQRHLDQASDRVRDLVLAGKHTVRPVAAGDREPTSSLPVPGHRGPRASGEAAPKRLPSLRPAQGQAAPTEATPGNSLRIAARHRRRKREKTRRKSETPSPQYPTFCLQELVVRAEAEARREARARGMLGVPASSPADMETVSETTTGCADELPLPLALLECYLESDNMQGDGSNIPRRGPVFTKSRRDGLQRNPRRSGEFRRPDHAAMETEPRPSPETVAMPHHRFPRFRDSGDRRHLRPADESEPAPNGGFDDWERNLASPGGISESPRDVIGLRVGRYFGSGDGPASPRRKRSDAQADADSTVVEYSDRPLPRASLPILGQRPRRNAVDGDRRRQRRKDAHRKQVRKLTRVHDDGQTSPDDGPVPVQTATAGEGNEYGDIHDRSGSFPEIEAVRRCQLISPEEERNKLKSTNR